MEFSLRSDDFYGYLRDLSSDEMTLFLGMWNLLEVYERAKEEVCRVAFIVRFDSLAEREKTRDHLGRLPCPCRGGLAWCQEDSVPGSQDSRDYYLLFFIDLDGTEGSDHVGDLVDCLRSCEGLVEHIPFSRWDEWCKKRKLGDPNPVASRVVMDETVPEGPFRTLTGCGTLEGMEETCGMLRKLCVER
jgi:hypothetical protein